MSGADKRLDRLYLGLTVKERALLVLQAVKEDRDADPLIAWSISLGSTLARAAITALVRAAEEMRDRGTFLVRRGPHFVP
jgi:hypothetical protein